MVNSVNPSVLCSLRISSAGIELPAAMPVRRRCSPVEGTLPEDRRSSSAMNIVGTPYKAVQACSWTAWRVALGEKDSAGKTMAAPWVAVAM